MTSFTFPSPKDIYSHLNLDETVPVLSGCAAFGATLALSTLTQKIVGISTGTKVLPTVNGFVTVCAASLVCEKVAILTHEWMKDPQGFQISAGRRIRQRFLSSTSSTNLPFGGGGGGGRQQHDQQQLNRIDNLNHRNRSHSEYWRMGNAKFPMHEVRVCLLGLLTFKALGGRFWAISPSSYTHMGSFARWSIPCTENYATATQRSMIERMGRMWGCHTCGSRMMFTSASSQGTGQTFRFVGDHMPPKSVAQEMNQSWLRKVGILPKVRFRFYPQCVTCSNVQGSILSKATSELKKGSSSSSVGRTIAGRVGIKSHLSSITRAASLKDAGGGTVAYFHGWRLRVNHLTGAVVAGTTVIGATDKEIRNGNPKRLEGVQHRIQKVIRKLVY